MPNQRYLSSQPNPNAPRPSGPVNLQNANMSQAQAAASGPAPGSMRSPEQYNQQGQTQTDVSLLPISPNTSAITKDILNRAAVGPAGAAPGQREALQRLLASGGDPRAAAAINAANQMAAQGNFMQMGARVAQNQTASGIGTAGSGVRADQLDLINKLQMAAAGQGPSQAQSQLQQGVAANIAAQNALANTGRGGSMASALRGAGQAGQNIAIQGQMQAAQLAAAEQQAAQQALGNALAGTRGQDVGQAVAQNAAINAMRAGDVGSAAALGQLQLAGGQLANTGAGQSVALAQGQQGMDANEHFNTLRALAQAEQLRTGARAQNLGLGAQQYEQDWNLLNTGTNVAATTLPFLAMSDRRHKKRISKASRSAMYELLEALKPYKYEYKDNANGEGKRLGPMAQDIARSVLGKHLVQEHEGALKLDVGKSFTAMLAAQGALHQRLKKLETANA